MTKIRCIHKIIAEILKCCEGGKITSRLSISVNLSRDKLNTLTEHLCEEGFIKEVKIKSAYSEKVVCNGYETAQKGRKFLEMFNDLPISCKISKEKKKAFKV